MLRIHMLAECSALSRTFKQPPLMGREHCRRGMGARRQGAELQTAIFRAWHSHCKHLWQLWMLALGQHKTGALAFLDELLATDGFWGSRGDSHCLQLTAYQTVAHSAPKGSSKPMATQKGLIKNQCVTK